MRFRLRREAPPAGLPLRAGEKVLAWCRATDGSVVAGTRDALLLDVDGGTRIPWEEVQAADWDQDSETLRVTEVGTWGHVRAAHEFTVSEPGLLLELVRERVTASVVLQRHVPVRGRRGVRVIARRAPGRHDPLFWMFEFDEGVDPDDPEVRAAADAALAEMRGQVGLD